MSSSKKEGWTFGASRRIDVPPVMIGEMEMTFKLDGKEIVPSSMIVFTNAADDGATRKMKFFCKKNALGWRHLEDNAFNVVGLYDALLRLTDQFCVKDWHWDRTVSVCNGSGSGEKPRIPVSREVVIQVVKDKETDELHDVVELEEKYGSEKRLHGDETLDKIDERKRAERRKEKKAFYAQFGIDPPSDEN